MIDQLFWICVEILQLIGDVTGMGYNLANLVIFVILQPALIVLFFVLWRKEVRKSKEAK
jgi:uncharacterized membrane protein|tara:strand:- start:125 stop:301 length:177 start_codon:yes stop_codon:yes gene_type:complete